MLNILKFAFATYLVNIAAGLVLGMLLALLRLPPTAFYTPWLHTEWVPLAPYPRLLAGLFVSIGLWVFATFIAGFFLKPLSPFRQTRPVPVSAWVEEGVVEFGRYVLGLCIIAAAVWAAPKMDTDPMAVLKTFSMLAAFTLVWAMLIKDQVWRESRRHNEMRMMLPRELRQ